jgi:uncharacterized protein with von Willebrand factor type A (vWA) domain
MASDLADVVVGFGRAARAAGINAGPDRVQSMAVALGHLDVLVESDVYWAGRLTFCGSPDDVERYDKAFARYFSGKTQAQPLERRKLVPQTRTVAEAAVDVADAEQLGERDVRLATASDMELLRSRDFAHLGQEQRDQVRRLIALLDARAPLRPSRRFKPSHRGHLDAERTVREMVRRGGEPVRLHRRDRRAKERGVIVIVDISGSMAPYADALLRFAHAASRRRAGRVDVFTLGTRLTRVSQQIRHRDPDEAMAAVAAEVPDWSGGTQLGVQLREFLDRWGQRGLARGAVVVIASDGWERGDASVLSDQMARLQRLAHKVVWVNPHRARPGFEPVTAGMAAALPHVDAFVSGHSLATLEELGEVIGSV